MGNRIRLMLVDDHAALRKGLSLLLEQSLPAIEVVAEAENGEQAYNQMGSASPEVIVMDLNMPGMGGLESLRHILARWPSIKIVVYSMHEEPAFVVQAMAAGARGYVTKSDDTKELVKAIQEVTLGARFISKNIAPKVALYALAGDDDLMALLSTREFEIFRLLAEGKGVEDIAAMLKLSQKTIANHQTTLKQKLKVTTPLEMVRLAIKYGVVKG
jgi:DNA-binding NarL/FixJ family response regulator